MIQLLQVLFVPSVLIRDDGSEEMAALERASKMTLMDMRQSPLTRFARDYHELNGRRICHSEDGAPPLQWWTAFVSLPFIAK